MCNTNTSNNLPQEAIQSKGLHPIPLEGAFIQVKVARFLIAMNFLFDYHYQWHCEYHVRVKYK